jgi:hypothetical protein
MLFKRSRRPLIGATSALALILAGGQGVAEFTHEQTNLHSSPIVLAQATTDVTSGGADALSGRCCRRCR